MPGYRTLCRSEEIPRGAGRGFDVDGAPVAVFRLEGGTLHAIENTCLHAGGPLDEGTLEGTTVVCPWHEWRFDVVTGACALNPCASLKRYEVRERDGRVELGPEVD